MGQLVSQDLPNLVGGVSQQSPSLRLVNQATEQINCWNSVVEGLMPRQATKRAGVSKIKTDDSYIMDYHRDEREHYRFVLNDDGGQKLKVFDADTGTEYPVEISGELEKKLNITGGQQRDVPYLNPLGDFSHREAFQLLPVKDSVLLLNRTFPTARVIGDSDDKSEPSTTEYRRYKLSITNLNYTRYGDKKLFKSRYGTAYYKYTINGKSFTFDYRWNSSQVAASLATQMSKALDGIEAGVNGSVITITVSPNKTINVSEQSMCRIQWSGFSGNGTWYPKTITVSSEKFSVVTGVTGRPNYEALLWVRRADYAVSYDVKVNDTKLSHKTPEATSSNARDGLRTEVIAASLATSVSGVTGITAVAKGNVVHISSEKDFTVEATDSLGGTALSSFKRRTRDETDLPGSDVPEGYKVQIRGEIDGSGGYWLEFDRSEGGKGLWKESTGYATENRFDNTTMPLLINRKQDIERVTETNPLGIYFEISTADWAPRKVGDEDSAPFPTFMSEHDLKTAEVKTQRRITAMGIYQNRLILASGDTLTHSEVNQFFNLFPTTVAASVDSDPLEVGLDTNDVVNIRHITPGSGSMVLWTDRKQYVLRPDEVLTSGTVKARMVTAEEADLSIEPLAVGNRIYFAANRGKHKAIKEFYSTGDAFQYDTEDVTAHVPEYINGTILKMVGNTSINSLFILTSDPEGGMYSSTVYVYNYFDQGDERVQSAWSKWEFGGRVVDLSVNNTKLSLLIERVTGKDAEGEPTKEVFLEHIELSYDELDQYHGHRLYLDSYAFQDKPYTADELMPGEITKKVDDRYYRGYPLEVMYEFSPFFLRDEKNTSRMDGRLQLRRLFLNYTDTSNFVIEVETLGREVRELVFQGRVLGRLDNLIGKVPVTSGRFSAPIMGQSGAIKVRIRNKEIFGFTFQSAYWEGFYHTRNRKV